MEIVEASGAVEGTEAEGLTEEGLAAGVGDMVIDLHLQGILVIDQHQEILEAGIL